MNSILEGKLLWVVLIRKSLGGNVRAGDVVKPGFLGLFDVEGALLGAIVEDGVDGLGLDVHVEALDSEHLVQGAGELHGAVFDCGLVGFHHVKSCSNALEVLAVG